MDGAEEVKQRTVHARNGCELLTSQLHNDFELTDLNLDNDDLAEVEGFALPGEVEEEAPSYTPSFCRNTQLELSTRPHLEPRPLAPRPPSPRPAMQAESEEVQPFCLDLSFDYDHVMLSCKHPAP